MKIELRINILIDFILNSGSWILNSIFYFFAQIQNVQTGPGEVRDIDEPPAVEINVVGLNHLLGPGLPFSYPSGQGYNARPLWA